MDLGLCARYPSRESTFARSKGRHSMTDVHELFSKAVATYWDVRAAQGRKQRTAGRRDQGARAAATGGKQMDGFIAAMAALLLDSGVSSDDIHTGKAVQTLPGFFRPTKEWDLLVVHHGHLQLALEVKSQVGPSFGNNFNNRTEEAMGSALDLWTAFREGAFGDAPAPWLGYMLLLEDCEASRRSVSSREPHFEVLPEFKQASYARRYELFCQKLVRERHYSATALLLSEREAGMSGLFSEPCEALGVQRFAESLVSHVAAQPR